MLNVQPLQDSKQMTSVKLVEQLLLRQLLLHELKTTKTNVLNTWSRILRTWRLRELSTHCDRELLGCRLLFNEELINDSFQHHAVYDGL